MSTPRRKPSAGVRAWAQPLLALAVACTLAGCFDLPEFAQSSLIDRPRILAVIADPPEVTPGSAVSLSVLVAGAEEVSQVRWYACSTVRSFSSSTQFGDNQGDQGCPADAIELGDASRTTLAAPATMSLFQNDALVRAALGAQGLSESALDTIRTQVGVAFTVEVEVLADGKRLRALKRVLVSENEQPGTNPPPPLLRIGRHILRSVGDGAPYRCVPDTGQVRFESGATVAAAPVFDGVEEPWLEQYSVLDARGEPGVRTEQAFYSWFVSAGSLESGSTRAPERDNAWRLPEEAGCAQLWLVVRDGHGGQTACSATVAVGDVDACEEP